MVINVLFIVNVYCVINRIYSVVNRKKKKTGLVLMCQIDKTLLTAHWFSLVLQSLNQGKTQAGLRKTHPWIKSLQPQNV